MSNSLDFQMTRGARGLRLRPMLRRATAVAVGAVMSLQTACYTYAPSFGGAPASGSSVALELSDQGRVDLGDQMGAGVTRVEGTVTGIGDSVYHLRVYGVTTTDGQASHWTGERVDVRQSDVSRVYQRSFSRGRTFTAVLAAVAAVTAIIVTRSLTGGGTMSTDKPGGPPQGT